MPRPRTMFDTARRPKQQPKRETFAPVMELEDVELETTPSIVEETGSRMYPCPHCDDKEYKSESALNRHIKQKHEETEDSD